MEATQLENKINHQDKNEIDLDSLKMDNKEFIKSNKLILKTQRQFKSERHTKDIILFTEEIYKIALSSDGDKRMQSIDSIEPYAHRTNKDLVSEHEEIKCNNIINQYKND